MPGTLLTLRRVGFSVAPGVDMQRLETPTKFLSTRRLELPLSCRDQINPSLPTTMLATTDFEFYVELRRRQHAIESTITGYKAIIADSERELQECLEIVQ
ncbi:hypothetical protein DFH08DRAFT_947916 [Mycena albidolilacea]|uniref:Uncharacterized protein n=1 Tax=Mycena albidolilacea TaxID=1033008 RepID=A0AAD7AWC3_9AGAR|nr:hypothetical protein DFH08DRAFT_947916 [Mycena albidolilacea]